MQQQGEGGEIVLSPPLRSSLKRGITDSVSPTQHLIVVIVRGLRGAKEGSRVYVAVDG